MLGVYRVPVIEVDSTDDPRLADYREVRDADLLGRRGVFMAEGREVVRTLLTRSRFTTRSVLVTPVALEAMADVLLESALPVYVLPQDRMNRVVGFDIHRGCLAAGERGTPPSVADVLGMLPPTGPARIVLLESLTNHDNVGAIFRNALALGAGAVILSPDCCDPLYRKAIRVSMGGVLRVPFARADAVGWPTEVMALLRSSGFTTLALTPVGEAPLPREPDPMGRWAVVIGAEGPGLTAGVMAQADRRVRIAMTPGVDSLNAAVASAIALHALFPGDTLTP